MVATDLWLPNGKHYTITGEGLQPIGNLTDEDGRSIGSLGELETFAITVCSLCNASSLKKR